MLPTRRVTRRLLPALLIALLTVALAACSDPQTTVEPKSDYADTVQGVYVIIFWVAAVVFVGVLAAILVISIVFRERPGREARQFHGNTRLEVVWTLIPVVIVVIISVPTFKAIADTTDPPPAEALEITVVGHQWWFEFEYPELGIVTANEIHIPVDQPVSFTLLSDDVIHSFWVPQLAGKVDIVPGHANELWFTPNEVRAEPYLGQCAEFCGTSHANMRFRVYVDTPADFDAWVANELGDAAEPVDDALVVGQQLFLTNACIGCHTIKGTIAAGTIGPNLTHVGGRATIAAGILDNTTPDDMVRWIMNPDEEKPGVVLMPASEESLSSDEIRSIVAYLQSLK